MSTHATEEGTPPETAGSILRDYGGAVVIAVVIALLIRFFGLEAYRIPSAAMRPTLEAGDTLFVAKWTYGVELPFGLGRIGGGTLPRRGDVVIFAAPNDRDRAYVKRVVGLPGDRMELRKGRIFRNGTDASVAGPPDAICGREKGDTGTFGVCWEPPVLDAMPPVTVPPGSVFVVGDLRSVPPNPGPGPAPDPREAVLKPRGWGLIPIEKLRGRAMWIWLSIDPPGDRGGSSAFSRIRFERMFRRIE